MKKLSPAYIAAIWLCVSQAAAQDQPAAASNQQCALTRLASLDMTRTSIGQISVPVSVVGTSRNFVVGFQGASAVTDAVATELKFRRSSTMTGWRGPIISIMGLPASDSVTVPDLQIGAVHAKDADMYVAGSRMSGGSTPYPGGDAIGGVIGTSLLRHFDVEFDFKSNKLNLYTPTSCGGNIVYWAHSYAAIPFQLNQIGDVVFQMQLDGKDVSVIPNLNGQHASMGTTAAEAIFGIKDGSPGFEPAALGDEKLYRYPFKTLAIGGLTINNPDIVIHKDTPSWQCNGKQYGFHVCFGGSDLTISQTELRALHLYFSFQDKMLYVTSADAHL